jgi:hypothetical protein
MISSMSSLDLLSANMDPRSRMFVDACGLLLAAQKHSETSMLASFRQALHDAHECSGGSGSYELLNLCSYSNNRREEVHIVRALVVV